ncbi:MAG TPA: 3'-5' exonuclease [Ureibacillus sp.]|nr:3'-5' exonuclease [Ureibacillus sp.]
MYSIYLTESAKEEMQSIRSNEIEKVSERLNLLKNGFWKNGTRVKKLRSLNKIAIYEARVDRAKRMLFTPIPISEEGVNKTAIMVFHLSVEHDKVIRTARNILGEEFNQEAYITAEETNEITLEQIVEEVNSTWYPEYYYPFTNQKMYCIDEDTIIRFMQKEDVAPDEFWDIKLRLTEEQLEVLDKPLPILMSGTAGSGKTTIVIHKLLSDPNLKKLYITYNKELVEDAKKQFLSLIRGLDEEQQYKENTIFLTFEEALTIYKDDEFLPIMSKERFIFEYSRFVRGNQLDKEFPPLMIWEEVRGVWKSGAFSQYNQIMGLNDYINLSEQEAPNFFHNREGAYKIFQWYQNWLKISSMMDEQDLLFKALNKDIPKYDMVICDEVQDLSMLHISFVIALANNQSNRIILTGDDHQVIQHSGFRWENIKNAFYQKLNTPINEIVQLSRNFRNTGKIAKLAASINNLQREYTDFQYKTKKTDYFDYGITPVIYNNIGEHQIIDKANLFGPHDAILVRNEEYKQSLKKQFIKEFGQSPLIFTISEAKGLEFNRVLLWTMFPKDSMEEKIWKKIYRIIDQGNLHLIDGNPINKRFIRYEASLLYVAVTRGMKNCFIYDGPQTAEFWRINDISKSLNVVSKIEKTEINAEPISMDDWIEQGIVLINKKLYQQALECFNRVPEDQVYQYKLLCEAHLAKEDADFLLAAEKFKLAENYDESLQCLDVSGQYQEAQRLCDLVIRKKQSDKLLIEKWEYLKSSFKVKEFDQRQLWVGSAIYCKRIGKYIEAINRFEKADSNLSTNRNLQHLYDELTRNTPIDLKILERAITYYENTKNPKKLDYLLQYKKSINL